MGVCVREREKVGRKEKLWSILTAGDVDLCHGGCSEQNGGDERSHGGFVLLDVHYDEGGGVELRFCE